MICSVIFKDSVRFSITHLFFKWENIWNNRLGLFRDYYCQWVWLSNPAHVNWVNSMCIARYKIWNQYYVLRTVSQSGFFLIIYNNFGCLMVVWSMKFMWSNWPNKCFGGSQHQRIWQIFNLWRGLGECYTTDSEIAGFIHDSKFYWLHCKVMWWKWGFITV